MTIPEQAGKVATSAIDAFKAQPGLLFLTLVNVSFLVFVYFIGTLVLDAYDKQQEQIHERYKVALNTIDRCINIGFAALERSMPTTRDPKDPFDPDHRDHL